MSDLKDLDTLLKKVDYLIIVTTHKEFVDMNLNKLKL